VIETVLAVVADIEIVEAVVVVVTDAGALPPTGELETRGPRYIGESSIMIVVKEMAGRRLFPFCRVKPSAVY
jgi:hypothetical protein